MNEAERRRRRRHEEELAGGLAFAEIAEIGSGAPRLVEHGLYSPARVRAARLERVREVLGDEAPRAEAVWAVEAWLNARAAEAAGAAAAAEAAAAAGPRRSAAEARVAGRFGGTRAGRRGHPMTRRPPVGPMLAAGAFGPRRASQVVGPRMGVSRRTRSGERGRGPAAGVRRVCQCVRRGRWPQAFRVRRWRRPGDRAAAWVLRPGQGLLDGRKGS